MTETIDRVKADIGLAINRLLASGNFIHFVEVMSKLAERKISEKEIELLYVHYEFYGMDRAMVLFESNPFISKRLHSDLEESENYIEGLKKEVWVIV